VSTRSKAGVSEVAQVKPSHKHYLSDVAACLLIRSHGASLVAHAASQADSYKELTTLHCNPLLAFVGTVLYHYQHRN